MHQKSEPQTSKHQFQLWKPLSLSRKLFSWFYTVRVICYSWKNDTNCHRGGSAPNHRQKFLLIICYKRVVQTLTVRKATWDPFPSGDIKWFYRKGVKTNGVVYVLLSLSPNVHRQQQTISHWLHMAWFQPWWWWVVLVFTLREQTIYVSRPQFDRSTGVVTLQAAEGNLFSLSFHPPYSSYTMDTLLKVKQLGMQQSVQ